MRDIRGPVAGRLGGPQWGRTLAVLSLGALACMQTLAADCGEAGLARHRGAVLQLREVGQPERNAMVYRDTAGAWFVPLQGSAVGDGRPDRIACTFQGLTYWKLAAGDPALTEDEDSGVLTYLDLRQATGVIDGRIQPRKPTGEALNSAGLNYQLGLNYAQDPLRSSLTTTAYGELYGRSQDWYYNTTLGWSQGGRVARYETYALTESIDTGISLRLGDSTTAPTALGEALQFAGVSWGTDRSLRPGDFSAVLPTLRNGNALAGPLEVFINDNLQFRQTLQNGVYDLRNLPAQQGFNSYSVRTLDALGNPVIVQREIYLPASLLPPGITSWRFDAGFQREDFFTANARYGAPFVAGSYSRGLSGNTTASAQGLASRSASTVSAAVDQRLGDLWTGRLGILAGRKDQQAGQALQWRIDGGGRYWRLLADWIHALRPLPGLGSQPPLTTQRLLQAQWSGLADWNFALTAATLQREQSAREEVATLSATTRVPDTAATLSLALSQVKSSSGKQDSLVLSFFLPLAPSPTGRTASVFGSQTRSDGVQLSRAQYSNAGPSAQAGNWTVGATQASVQALSSVDAYGSQSIGKANFTASGRVSGQDRNAQLMVRSGLLLTRGGLYATQPVTSSFAMVSTGVPDVEVFYENRSVGRTDRNGYLLVPELRALENNRLALDPRTWPMDWVSNDIEHQVVPPRGGGVLVSFRINAQVWPGQAMLTPLDPDGRLLPPGTVVTAEVDGQTQEAVVDRRGQVWIPELLPATAFSVRLQGKRCQYTLPPTPATSAQQSMTRLAPDRCVEGS